MLPRKAYSLAQKVLELRRFQKNAISQVWMLHEAYADGETPHEAYLAISRDRFAGLLEAYGFRIRPLSCLAEPGSIHVTFDDIFASACQNAVPLLRERRLPYTVFIAPELVDRPGYVTSGQLKDLASDPLCTIGAHSMSHCLMRPLSEADCLAELADSKRWLEDFCGREVDCFAFPYGSVYACSRANIRQVERAGFRYGFSTLNRGVLAEDLARPWFLPRINVNDDFR